MRRRLAPCKQWVVGALALASISACGPGRAPMADAAAFGSDVGGGSSADPTPAERAACANLAAIAPCTMGLDEEGACLAYLVDLRTDLAEPDCRAEYDAWIGCIEALPACMGTSVVCPEQYSLFGRCAGPRP